MKLFSRYLALAAIVFCGLGLRLAHIDADGPMIFPNGFSSSAPVKDEAAKCYAPRSRVLWGKWTANEADDYRYWDTLSPVWTYSLYAWLRLGRPAYEWARGYAVAWSGLSILLLYWILARRSAGAALFAAALFAVNVYAVHYGRLALLETPLNGLLIVAFALQAKAKDQPAYMALAALCWLMAWFTKQSAVVYAPVLAGGALIMYLRADGENRKYYLIGVAATLVVLAMAAACFLDFDYRVRSVMNVRHAMDYRPDPTYLWMRVSPARTWEAVAANLTTGVFNGYFLMSPVASVLALIEIGAIAADFRRGKYVDAISVTAVIWWLSARVVLIFQAHESVRFYLVQLPPTVILGAMAVDRMLKGSSRNRSKIGFVLFAAFASLAVHLPPWLVWHAAHPLEVEKGAKNLRLLVPEGEAVLAGEWAPPLAFNGGQRYFYLKNVFNREPERIKALGVTHLVVDSSKLGGPDMDPAVRRTRKFFPSAWDKRAELGRFKLWEGEDGEVEIIVFRVLLE